MWCILVLLHFFMYFPVLVYLSSLNLVRFCSDRILVVIGNRRSNLGRLRKGSREPERGTDACNESLRSALPPCSVYIIASSRYLSLAYVEQEIFLAIEYSCGKF